MPLIRVGAVFWIEDRLVKPVSASGKSHPYVIIGSGVRGDDKPRVAKQRLVQLCCRSSYKPEFDGPAPESESARAAFGQAKALVFSPANPALGLEVDGVFTVTQHAALVGDLLDAGFCGWLPREELDLLLLRRAMKLIAGQYPPSESGR